MRLPDHPRRKVPHLRQPQPGLAELSGRLLAMTVERHQRGPCAYGCCPKCCYLCETLYGYYAHYAAAADVLIERCGVNGMVWQNEDGIDWGKVASSWSSGHVCDCCDGKGES